jgi:hypothetical protein
MKETCVAALCLLIGGCAAFDTSAVVEPSNRQTGAGVTDFSLDTGIGADGESYISRMHLLDGKEKNRVLATIELPSGLKARYEAEGIKAFPGQELQSVVQKAFVDAGVQQTDAIKELIPKVVEALKPIWTR